MTAIDDGAHARLPSLIEQARGDTLRLIDAGLALAPPVIAASGRRAARRSPPWQGRPPLIRFDLRGQSAGQFRVDGAGCPEVRYNPVLLLRHAEDFLARTVPHETAHYLTYRLFGLGVRPHGPEWQAIMQALGADPRRCHDYDVSDLAARRLRYYVYHCGCREHHLSSIRHNKIAGGARYHCRACGDTLRAGPRPR